MGNPWHTLLAIDFDRWAAETYRANFPGVRVVEGPVASWLEELPDADVILGGPPCQPFSDAGENEGESDERDCIPDFCEAVERKRPRMFLMENVRGLLKERHLPYFGRVLSRLEAAGYVVEWRLLDAVSFGVPQFRERVWVWGIRRDLYDSGVRHRWPRPTHAWPPPEECMFGGALLPGVTVGQALGVDYGQPTTARTEYANLNPSIVRGPSDFVKRQPHGHDDEPMCTLGSQTVPLVAIRRARGKGMCERGGSRRDHPVTEPCPTISANMATGGGAGLMAVIEYRWSDAMLTKHPPASPASPAPTVQAKWFKGGAEGLLAVGAAYNCRGKGDGGNQWRDTNEPAPTLNTNGLDGIDHPAHTISGESREPIQGWKDKGYVRRLTPDECLRLQSGPDDFTWPDKITKTAKYRVVGNGWACRMGAVFAEAFAMADPESLTVIDLFCGGGLGAVGWHGRFWSYGAAALPRLAAPGAGKGGGDA